MGAFLVPSFQSFGPTGLFLQFTQCFTSVCIWLLAGYGRFHYLLLAVCGLVSTSEEMDVISMSFILPSAQCDLNLTTYTKVRTPLRYPGYMEFMDARYYSANQ